MKDQAQILYLLRWKIIVTIGVSSCASYFSNLDVNSSGPHALRPSPKKFFTYLKSIRKESNGVPTLKAFGETVNEIQDKTNLLNRQFQLVFTHLFYLLGQCCQICNSSKPLWSFICSIYWGNAVRYVIPVSLSTNEWPERLTGITYLTALPQ
jgi:hypothetical protein